MTTREQLWAAICAAPEDDTARGALADWLDENGDPDHASLIRVQLELAGHDWVSDVPRKGSEEFDRRGWELHHIVNALLALVEPRLRRGERCQPCQVDQAFRLRVPAYVCPHCSGMGWAGALSEQTREMISYSTMRGDHGQIPGIACWLIPARWSRGFVSSITCPLAWWMRHGRQACREWPLESVECSDKSPMHSPGNSEWGYGWSSVEHNGDDDSDVYVLPDDIYKHLPEGRFAPHGNRWLFWKYYDTEPAARHALSAALLTWSRNPEPVRR